MVDKKYKRKNIDLPLTLERTLLVAAAKAGVCAKHYLEEVVTKHLLAAAEAESGTEVKLKEDLGSGSY